MRKVVLFIVLIAATTVAFAQNAKATKYEVEADTAMQRQDYARAIKLYTKAIGASKLKERSDYGAVYKRAVSYYSTGDFKNALADLDKVVPQFPNLPQARMLRALVYGELGDSVKKKEDLAQALLADPGNADMLKWRASIYLEDEDYELAKKDLQVASLFRDDPETEMYLGVAQYNSGSLDSALVSLDKAIALDAAYMPAYMYAGSFCLQEDRYDQALQYLNIAGQLEPKNTTIMFYRGIALVELEKEEEGCRLLRKAFYSGLDDASGYLKEYCFGVEN